MVRSEGSLVLVGSLRCWQSTLGRRRAEVCVQCFTAASFQDAENSLPSLSSHVFPFFDPTLSFLFIYLLLFLYCPVLLSQLESFLLTRGISHDTVNVVLPPDFNANPPIRLIRVREIPLLILVKAADLGTCPCIGSQSEGTLSHKFSLGISKGKGICHPMYSKLGGYFFLVPGKAEMPRGEPVPRHVTTLL